jgi:hypothetical protein
MNIATHADSSIVIQPVNPDFNYTEELCFQPLIPDTPFFAFPSMA